MSVMLIEHVSADLSHLDINKFSRVTIGNDNGGQFASVKVKGVHCFERKVWW